MVILPRNHYVTWHINARIMSPKQCRLGCEHYISVIFNKGEIIIKKTCWTRRLQSTIMCPGINVLPHWRLGAYACVYELCHHWLNLIAHMARVFGMNPKVGGSIPPRVETFSVSKTSTLTQEHPFVSCKWIVLPTHSWHFKSQFYKQNIYTASASVTKYKIGKFITR